MNDSEPAVFVVDDDEALCESLQWLLEPEGLRVRTFSSAEVFLSQVSPRQAGCLVLDVRMRGMSGLDLQARLVESGATMPVIILTGHGDVPMAVRAVKAGALEFLEKPVNDQVLLGCIRRALAEDAAARAQRAAREDAQTRIRTLTPREREVMELVVTGYANKRIASRLGICEKTVEVHRRRVMQKMGVRTAVDLVRLAVSQEVSSQEPAR
jgi:FixJ family two-component response regulator